MSDQLAVGTIVHRYRIEAVVGVGGMGTVYRATHVPTGRVVAVKGLHRHVARKAEHQKRFLREARAAIAVAHPNIVQVHEVFEYDDAPMLAMELLTGESLEALLVRERRLSVDRTARIMLHVTSALGTAHAIGIVHRDVKPDNFFLCGNDDQVKVLDFGIAKLTATHGAAAETAALTRTGALIGTPFYMSPEQAFGEKRIDHRADIWSLGVVIYRCLTGVLVTYGASFSEVFRAVVSAEFPPIQQHNPAVPDEIAALVKRMLQRAPADRPADLREVYAVLERFAAASTAPVFGMAVAPLFDELSADDTPDPGDQARPDPALGSSQALTLALTPSSLRAGRAAPPSGGAAAAPTIVGAEKVGWVGATAWIALGVALVVLAGAVVFMLRAGR